MTYLGVGYYAIQARNFRGMSIEVFNRVEKPALSFLWSTFGTRKKIIKKYLKKVADRPHLLQIHLMNHVCVRNNNCKKGEIKKKWDIATWNRELVSGNARLIKKISKRVIKIRRFCESSSNNNTRLVLGAALEDNLSNAASRILITAIRENWPYGISRNPVGSNLSNSISGANSIELHHIGPTASGRNPYIVNLDGQDINFPHRRTTISHSASLPEIRSWINFHKNRANCIAIFLWSALWQGIHGDTKKSLAPRRRIHRVSAEDIHITNQLLLGN